MPTPAPDTLIPPEHLFAYDDGMLNVEESQLVFHGATGTKRLEDYLYGDCHLMALALHAVSELPMGAIIGTFWDDNDQPFLGLVHAYCVADKPDGAWGLDGRGFRLADEYLNEYPHEGELQVVQGIEVHGLIHDWIDRGLLRSFESGEEAALISYAEQLKQLGVLDTELASRSEIAEPLPSPFPSHYRAAWESPCP